MTTTKTFDEVTSEFRAAAAHEQLSDQVTNNTIDVLRAPWSSIDAVTTAIRWSTAPPGDPTSNLSLVDLQQLFGGAVKDWERAGQALGDVRAQVATSTTLDKTADAARKADWDGLRAQIASEVQVKDDRVDRLFASLDDGIAAARGGDVLKPLDDSIQLGAETARIYADAYDALLNDDTKRKNWDDAWDSAAKATGAVVAGFASYGCYTASASSTATLVASAGWYVGAIACGGVAIGLASYAVFKFGMFLNS